MHKDFKQSITQLTEAGNAEAVNIADRKAKGGTVAITVATIDTNVVLRVDSSDDGFSTAKQGSPVTITANGKYWLPLDLTAKENRLVFVSESGGTAVTVDADYELVLGN